MWDVAARYAGEVHDFKVAAVAAYNEVDDPNYNNLGNYFGQGLGTTASPFVPATLPSSQYFQAGLYVEHIPTGLFAMVNYGHMNLDEGSGSLSGAVGGDQQTWYGKAGIRQRWNPLGHTVLYGEYENGHDGSELCSATPGCTHSDVQLWGGGVVQEIDAAAMSVWVKYRNLSYDDSVNKGPVLGINDFNYVGMGALINF
jgi:hypothetical protein